MSTTIAARVRALEAARPQREEHFILTEPGESAEAALRRHGLDPERLPRFFAVVPRKRGASDAQH